jgi:hypothetical protein
MFATDHATQHRQDHKEENKFSHTLILIEIVGLANLWQASGKPHGGEK